jgi:hypothetical protein
MKDFPLPGSGRYVVAVPAPGRGTGNWAGSSSAVVDADGTIVVAYRVRHGEAAENPVETVVARSEDGERFVTLATLEKERFEAEGRDLIDVAPAQPDTSRCQARVRMCDELVAEAGNASGRTGSRSSYRCQAPVRKCDAHGARTLLT